MKTKLYHSIVLASLALHVQAQLTPANDFSKPDTTVSYGSSTKIVNVGSAGQNKTWDFSKVVLLSPAFSATFVPNIHTPGFSVFPTANLASTAIRILPDGSITQDSTIGFVHYTDQYADELGSYTQVNGQKTFQMTNNVPERIAVFPFNYGDQFSYVIDAQIEEIDTLGGTGMITFPRKGNGTWKFDGTGTILYPGQNTPVAAERYSLIETSFDTIIGNISGIDYKNYISYKQISYSFNSADGQGIDVYYNTTVINNYYVNPVGGGFVSSGPETMMDTSVTYSKSTTIKDIRQIAGIDPSGDEVLNSFSVYPNPSTNGLLHLSAPERLASVALFHSDGSLVYKSNPSATLQIPEQSGLYLVKAILPDGKSKTFKVNRQ